MLPTILGAHPELFYIYHLTDASEPMPAPCANWHIYISSGFPGNDGPLQCRWQAPSLRILFLHNVLFPCCGIIWYVLEGAFKTLANNFPSGSIPVPEIITAPNSTTPRFRRGNARHQLRRQASLKTLTSPHTAGINTEDDARDNIRVATGPEPVELAAICGTIYIESVGIVSVDGGIDTQGCMPPAVNFVQFRNGLVCLGANWIAVVEGVCGICPTLRASV